MNALQMTYKSGLSVDYFICSIPDNSMLSDKTENQLNTSNDAVIDNANQPVEDDKIYLFDTCDNDYQYYRVNIIDAGYKLSKDNPQYSQIIHLNETELQSILVGKVVGFNVVYDTAMEAF